MLTVPDLVNVTPVSTAPVAAIAPTRQIGTSTIPLRVNWSASVSLAQQKATAVTYPKGTWKAKSHSSASGGSYRTSRTKGGKVRFSFTGTQVNWIGITASSRGKAKVYLDGVYQKTVDTYSSSRQFRRILFNKTVPAGKHTLVIRVLGARNAKSSGKYIDADAFVTKS